MGDRSRRGLARSRRFLAPDDQRSRCNRCGDGGARRRHWVPRDVHDVMRCLRVRLRVDVSGHPRRNRNAPLAACRVRDDGGLVLRRGTYLRVDTAPDRNACASASLVKTRIGFVVAAMTTSRSERYQTRTAYARSSPVLRCQTLRRPETRSRSTQTASRSLQRHPPSSRQGEDRPQP
jgi:hypothetical protein